MKFNSHSRTLSLLLFAFMILSVVNLTAGQGSDQGPELKIENVDLKIENKTSTLSIDLEISGTAPEGTLFVNLTLGIENETMDERLPVWLEPMNENFLLYAGVSHGPKGPSEDPWTRWETDAFVNLPMGEDLIILLELLGVTLGLNSSLLEGFDEIEGLGNLTMPANITGFEDLMDLVTIPPKEEALSYLEGTEIRLVARAVDGDGRYNETSTDIKIELMDSLYDFLITEGYVEGELSDDGEEQGDNSGREDEKDDEMNLLPVLLLIVGIGLVVFSVVALTIFMLARKKQ